MIEGLFVEVIGLRMFGVGWFVAARLVNLSQIHDELSMCRRSSLSIAKDTTDLASQGAVRGVDNFG